MISHQYFDIFLHTDEELSQILGEGITGRETLHEWPLSCVQRVSLATGQTCIYKAETGPTVEAEFYAAAQSSLLPVARTVYRDDRYACLVIEDIRGPSLQDVALDEPAALASGYAILSEIAAIQGNPPVYLDVSSWERWQALMSGMLDDLSGLVADHRFQVTRLDSLDALAGAAQSAQVRDAYAIAAEEGRLGLVHQDLSAENVILRRFGKQSASQADQNIPRTEFRVVDWQRPQRGLVEIDLAHLLSSLGFDPRPHLHPGIPIAADLLRAHWLCECALTWFLPGIQTYDQMIAAIARSVK